MNSVARHWWLKEQRYLGIKTVAEVVGSLSLVVAVCGLLTWVPIASVAACINGASMVYVASWAHGQSLIARTQFDIAVSNDANMHRHRQRARWRRTLDE